MNQFAVEILILPFKIMSNYYAVVVYCLFPYNLTFLSCKIRIKTDTKIALATHLKLLVN